MGLKASRIRVPGLAGHDDPAGWLAATIRRECRRVATAARGPEPPEPPDAAAAGEEVIMAERNAALRAALAELPARLGLAETGGNRPGGDPGA